MIKGVIYDMDGLMVNSEPLHAEAWDILLKTYGHKFSDLKNLRPSFIGMRIVDIAKEIIKHLNLEVELNIFYRKRIEIFLKLVRERLQIMPGLLESLTLFKKNNFTIALASSGTKEYIDLVLDKFRIRNYFDVIVSGDDVKIGKPHPETYLLTCKKLKLKSEECLVLEDATKGVESAKEAGCKCIGIINRNVNQDYSKADTVLSSLKELNLDVIRDC